LSPIPAVYLTFLNIPTTKKLRVPKFRDPRTTSAFLNFELLRTRVNNYSSLKFAKTFQKK
ncbi:unnamed protein product, partial [Tenebrio molitor]